MKYVNQGLGSCVLHSEGSNYVLRVTKHALESEETLAIQQRLAELDPKGQRFGYSKHLETLTLSDLSAQWPEVYKAYQQCEASADHSQKTFGTNAGSPSKQVSISEMLLLHPRPAKALEKYQASYLKESLKILHLAGIVHDDIHENNIMSTANGTSSFWWPILVDWDQARFSTNASDFAKDAERLEETIQKINTDNQRAAGRKPKRRQSPGSARSGFSSARSSARKGRRGLFGSSRKSSPQGLKFSPGAAAAARAASPKHSPPSAKRTRLVGPNFNF